MRYCRECQDDTLHTKHPCQVPHPKATYSLESQKKPDWKMYEHIDSFYYICDVCGTDQPDQYGRILMSGCPLESRLVGLVGHRVWVRPSDEVMAQANQMYKKLIIDGHKRPEALGLVWEFIKP